MAMSSSKRVVAVIPARYGSQRLPGKPLADLCGKPMIRHVYERVSRARCIAQVIVATDDDRIAAVVQEFGGQAVTTPGSLPTGSDRVAYVARTLHDADIVINVQGDEPLIEPVVIDEAVMPLLDGNAAPVSTLIKRITDLHELTNPGIVKVVVDRDMNALYFSRAPIPVSREGDRTEWLGRHAYYKHVGLYAFQREFLARFAGMAQTPLEKAEMLEQLRILEHGYRITCVPTTFESIPVDTAEDLAKVRSLLSAAAGAGRTTA